MKVVGLLGVLLVPLRRLLLGLLPVPLRRLLLGVAPVLLQVVLLQLLPERNPGLLVSPMMWADTPRPVPSSASQLRTRVCLLLLCIWMTWHSPLVWHSLVWHSPLVCATYYYAIMWISCYFM